MANKEIDVSVLESQGATQRQVIEELQKRRPGDQTGRDETILDWGNYTAIDPSMMVNDVGSKADSFMSVV